MLDALIIGAGGAGLTATAWDGRGRYAAQAWFIHIKEKEKVQHV
jgi:thioredoxin reductase